MWRLAFKQMDFDRTKTVLTAVAVSVAIAVILILRGFEQGLYEQSEDVVLDRGGDLILTQAGVSNFLAVRSSLPQLSRKRVEAVEGVKMAHAMTGFWVIYGPPGNKMPLLMLVYESYGGPTHIVEGGPIKDSRDIIIDTGLSEKFNLKPGDNLEVFEFEFRVAGITSGSSALFSTIGFVTYDGMLDLLLGSDIAPDLSAFPLLSFLLVETNADADTGSVAQAIENHVPEVDVFTPSQLAQNDVDLGRELFGPIMGVLISLAYFIGLLVIGLIVYADVQTRHRQYGVMKALGFRLSHISRSVLAQTLMLMLLAFPFGVLLAALVGRGIEWLAPVYAVYVLDPFGLGQVLLGLILITLPGSLLPLRMIAKTDPVVAFQAE